MKRLAPSRAASSAPALTSRTVRRHILWLALGSLALGIALVALRGEPRWNGDQGVFLSIAARVLDGDRLYADVIDNKDPLFFYAHAAALWIGGWRGPAALDGLWLALAAFSMALLLRELKAPRAVVTTGFFVYPLALVASWYEPGLSMLGGLAVAPLVGWLWARGSFALSGSVLGVTTLLKITVAPVAAAPALALLALGPVTKGRGSAAVRGALGLGVALGAIAAVLALRGELRGYLEVLAFNVRYPDDARQVQGGSGGIGSHVDVVRAFFETSGRWQFPLALAALAFVVAAPLVGWRRGGDAFRSLAASALAATCAALGVLALTAIWVHHLQLLALPGALVAALAVSVAAGYRRQVGAVAGAALVAFASWAVLKQEIDERPYGKAWSSARSSVGADLLEAARERFHADDDRVTYMVLGSNSENAHAVFIDRAFDLECRWFHLYPNNTPEQLRETSACGREEMPELVLVTVGFYEPRGGTDAWDEFVADSKHLLASSYELLAEQDDFQVWRRASGDADG